MTEIGDQDLKLLEIKVYDTYREDGAPYSYDYLVDCRQKLMRKLDYCRKEMQVLKKHKLKSEAQQREEVQRIRQFEVLHLQSPALGELLEQLWENQVLLEKS